MFYVIIPKSMNVLFNYPQINERFIWLSPNQWTFYLIIPKSMNVLFNYPQINERFI